MWRWRACLRRRRLAGRRCSAHGCGLVFQHLDDIGTYGLVGRFTVGIELEGAMGLREALAIRVGYRRSVGVEREAALARSRLLRMLLGERNLIDIVGLAGDPEIEFAILAEVGEVVPRLEAACELGVGAYHVAFRADVEHLNHVDIL